MKRNELGLISNDYERLYNVWKNMVSRCTNKSDDRFYTYGARGITVCEEWKSNFHKFAKWAVENGWKPSLSIERKELSVGYCPQNCTFIIMAEQARNKTSNVRIIFNGEDKCVAEWCEELGISAKMVYARYASGIRDANVLLYSGDLRNFKTQHSGRCLPLLT